MSVTQIFCLLVSLSYSFSFLSDPYYPRVVTKVLSVQHHGTWGTWGIKDYCEKGFYAVGYEMKRGDDTAANYVKFKCRTFEDQLGSYELVKPPGQGLWGTWSEWSDSCPANSVICGIQTKGEAPLVFGDDTALNDVLFMCCDRDLRIK